MTCRLAGAGFCSRPRDISILLSLALKLAKMTKIPVLDPDGSFGSDLNFETNSMPDLETKIRSAWIGRVSGCLLGKPVERMSIREGHSVLASYLSDVGSLPLCPFAP